MRSLQADSMVAMRASSKSVDTVNIVTIVDQFTNESETETVDDWGQVIKGVEIFLEAHYLFKRVLLTVPDTKLTVEGLSL